LLFLLTHREISFSPVAPATRFIGSDCNGPKLDAVQRCTAMLTGSTAAA
jgi:hypothetical protein